MPDLLKIAVAPERLDEGAPEERATFGLFSIRAGEAVLTEGYDTFVSARREGPLVSAYHAAEWFAWNWWRLRWEPRSQAPDWWRAHKMTAIGEGYAWPVITIFSDGIMTALLSDASARPDAKPFRYYGAHACVVPSTAFEGALDTFIAQVQERLRNQGVRETNLDRLWRDLMTERRDPSLALRRKFEALLGVEPDEGDPEVLAQMERDAEALGQDAIEEIAAGHHGHHGDHGDKKVTTAVEMREIAQTKGVDGLAGSAVRLGGDVRPSPLANEPAWQLGKRFAEALREQEHLAGEPVSDARLSEMADVPIALLGRDGSRAHLSFVLEEKAGACRVVLRSRWDTGRRFDLARLLGDRLMNAAHNEHLYPATRAYTYRQKAQRAFAAEFLAPFSKVDAMLEDDYSDENRQEEVAEHFQVSPKTIHTLLVNHHRLERDGLGYDFDVAVA
ncbi:MAG: ImmA/IrrE family metallo-endopeptidase [Alphaproteobacteria bacterium]